MAQALAQIAAALASNGRDLGFAQHGPRVQGYNGHLMGNRDIQTAWRYHNATKHSYASVRTNPHTLDWNNKPLEFKIYPTLEVKRLPRGAGHVEVPALSAIATNVVGEREAIADYESLAQLLLLSAGITKSRKYPGGEVFFRAAACTGALYEIELYIVCGDMPGLTAGVYHFGVAEFGLRQLRSGDFRGVLGQATDNEPSVVQAPLVIVCTATYWRNSWKYQARTYRHFGWDNGTILANMLAVCRALELPAKVIAGFVDSSVNRLLDIDTQREVAFSLVAIGHQTASVPAPLEPTPLALPLTPLSQREQDYPLMREMHEASSLATPEEVSAWRARTWDYHREKRQGKLLDLQPLAVPDVARDSIEPVILRRGSTRQFAPVPISFPQLSTILERATRGLPADFLQPTATQLNELYLIVNSVDGLAPGAYFYAREQQALEILRHGNFRKLAGYLALEQQLPADASTAVFMLADLNRILDRFGNRGYRAVHLEAGMLGGKLYLGAYAQRLGATGLTFYDDDVVRFFSPHADGKSAIFLVALGKSR